MKLRKSVLILVMLLLMLSLASVLFACADNDDIPQEDSYVNYKVSSSVADYFENDGGREDFAEYVNTYQQYSDLLETEGFSLNPGYDATYFRSPEADGSAPQEKDVPGLYFCFFRSNVYNDVNLKFKIVKERLSYYYTVRVELDYEEVDGALYNSTRYWCIVCELDEQIFVEQPDFIPEQEKEPVKYEMSEYVDSEQNKLCVAAGYNFWYETSDNKYTKHFVYTAPYSTEYTVVNSNKIEKIELNGRVLELDDGYLKDCSIRINKGETIELVVTYPQYATNDRTCVIYLYPSDRLTSITLQPGEDYALTIYPIKKLKENQSSIPSNDKTSRVKNISTDNPAVVFLKVQQFDDALGWIDNSLYADNYSTPAKECGLILEDYGTYRFVLRNTSDREISINVNISDPPTLNCEDTLEIPVSFSGNDGYRVFKFEKESASKTKYHVAIDGINFISYCCSLNTIGFEENLPANVLSQLSEYSKNNDSNFNIGTEDNSVMYIFLKSDKPLITTLMVTKLS